MQAATVHSVVAVYTPKRFYWYAKVLSVGWGTLLLTGILWSIISKKKKKAKAVFLQTDFDLDCQVPENNSEYFTYEVNK